MESGILFSDNDMVYAESRSVTRYPPGPGLYSHRSIDQVIAFDTNCFSEVYNLSSLGIRK